MNQDGSHFHYVCTHEDAKKLIAGHQRFWLSNCGCREGRGTCARSRIDLCLMFRGDLNASGSGMREISPDDVKAILREAKDKNLVSRPFRNEKDRTVTEGICFCCDDCCGYFLNPEEVCDRGTHVEKTDMQQCNDCGICADVCYFGVRSMEDDKLLLKHGNCYGCGLCVDACPEECIEMVTAR